MEIAADGNGKLVRGTITEQVADIPTAMMGEWGSGGPVIAFLGEYDALPGGAGVTP